MGSNFPQCDPFSDVPLDDDTSADVVTREMRYRPPLTEARPCLKLLSGVSGVDVGRTFPLRTGLNVIGRSPTVDISLDDESVSRQHCEISVGRRETTTIRDLGSTNGTRVGEDDIGVRLHRLEEGAQIRLSASVLLKFTWQDEVEEAVNRRLYDAAVRDPLTGLYNRRYLIERFDQEHAWALRNGRPLSLVIFDLDHFKKVNDTYGHDAGDAVLRAVASQVAEGIRQEDVLARFGGEEFVLLMRETPVKRAVEVAERIRRSIAGAPVLHEGKRIPVSTSLGVAASAEAWVVCPMDIFTRADRRLYRAKSSGRNRVVFED